LKQGQWAFSPVRIVVLAKPRWVVSLVGLETETVGFSPVRIDVLAKPRWVVSSVGRAVGF
tara:strand:+ start:285 stop:464 length:180 start_codon:yes stop_codon:yes gene_type:complete